MTDIIDDVFGEETVRFKAESNALDIVKKFQKDSNRAISKNLKKSLGDEKGYASVISDPEHIAIINDRSSEGMLITKETVKTFDNLMLLHMATGARSLIAHVELKKRLEDYEKQMIEVYGQRYMDGVQRTKVNVKRAPAD